MREDTENLALRLGIVADLLAQGRTINLFSNFCSLIAIGGLLRLSFHDAPMSVRALLALSMFAGLTQIWLAIRTGFDARLFRRLAATPDNLASFDSAMTALALMPQGKAGRPVEARIRGAQRLLRLQGLATSLQVITIAAAALILGIGG